MSGRPSGHVADEKARSRQLRPSETVAVADYPAYRGIPQALEEANVSGIGRAQLQLIAASLSQRDWRILHFLAAQKFATTTHLRRVFFTGHATQTAATRACLRVLDRLLSHRLVGRLERRVGGLRHGSAGFTWHLDVAGERLTRPDGANRRAIDEPSPAFLDHTLAVTDTVVTLTELGETGLRLARIDVETAAWRTHLTAHGTTAILKPDLFATISGIDYDDHWYLEIDRGTESIPVLLAKSRAYDAYRRTGHAQAELGVFPRVLWIVPTQRRAERLRTAIHATTDLSGRLFAVITPDALEQTLREPPEPSTTYTQPINAEGRNTNEP